FSGNSAGAIVALLLAVGYTPKEMTVELIQSRTLEKIRFPNLMSMVHGEGAMKLDPFEHWMERMVINKIGTLPTFQELYEKFGKILYCSAYNMTDRRPEILSYATTPDLSCVRGTIMSSSIPFIFKSPKYKGKEYIDGLVCDNLPFRMWNGKTKGILVIACEEREDKLMEGTSTNDNFVNYALEILSISRGILTKRSLEDAKKHPGITLLLLNPKDKLSSLDFTASISRRLNLFSEGYSGAKIKFLSSKQI
ncbi:unnamed protein product, partial [marine sediment metagenome]